jgi:hypothetical protein
VEFLGRPVLGVGAAREDSVALALDGGGQLVNYLKDNLRNGAGGL